MRFALGIAACLALAAPSFAYVNSGLPNPDAARIYSKLLEKDPKAAAEFLRKFEREEREQAQIRMASQTYLMNEFEKTVLEPLSAAAAKSPNDAMAYYRRGRAIQENIHRVKDARKRAEADFGMAIQLDPNFAPAYFRRGMHVKGILTSREQMFRDFETAIRLEPNNVAMRCCVALEHLRRADKGADPLQGFQHAAAASQLTQYRDPDVLQLMALACHYADDQTSALKYQEAAQRILQSGPEFARARQQFQAYQTNKGVLRLDAKEYLRRFGEK